MDEDLRQKEIVGTSQSSKERQKQKVEGRSVGVKVRPIR